MKIFSFIVSLIALAICIISLCRTYPRTEELGIDYMGILVGILSVIALFAISWQIYNTVTFEARMKVFVNEEIEKIKESNSEKYAKQANQIDYGIYFVQGLSLPDNPLAAYASYLIALCYALKNEDKTRIDATLNNMDIVLNELNSENYTAYDVNSAYRGIANDTNEKITPLEFIKEHELYPFIKDKFNEVEQKRISMVDEIEKSM